MMKTNLDKRVNRRVRNLNKRLKNSYNNRYSVRQMSKTMPWAQAQNLQFYTYVIVDNLERAFNIFTYTEIDIFVLGQIEYDLDKFIRRQGRKAGGR